VGLAFAVLATLLQTGPVFTFAPLKPKFERINPVAGLKRVFNKRVLFEGFKTCLKLGLFAAILYGFFAGVWPLLPAAASADTSVQVGFLAATGGALLFRLGLALLIIGVLDLAYVRWQFAKQMMMSRRELKEEIKRREGDPLVRQKLRELQRENLKQARSLGRVPEADVLITNPEHLAIALRYVSGEMSAPHVIAKGADAWAVEMKAIARRHDIPAFERRSLARQLFRSTQLDRPIPFEAFVDVARVYAEAASERARTARHVVRR
jgi:flagellar biosynthetic protein FlhB